MTSSDNDNMLSTVGEAFWTGVNDRASEGRWVDSVGVSLHSGYRRWSSGEPNNKGDEDCVEIDSDGNWNDEDCDDTRRFFCQVSWGSWSSWSSCSTTCGSGSQRSTRSCPVTGGCPGFSTWTKPCNLRLCQSWGSWDSWGPCSINCGPGTQTAVKKCTDANNADRTNCNGPTPSKTQDCKLKECVTIECEKEKMCVKFDMQHLRRNSLSNDYELNLDSCDAKDTRTITSEDVEMCADLGIGKCGAEMEMNSTHVNYKNNVLATRILVPGTIRFENVAYNEYKLPYHCAYPLEYLVTPSVDTDNDGIPDSNYGSFVPKISEVVTVVPVDMIKGGIKGDGKFPVAMMMYKTAGYTTVYDSPPTLNVDTRLYIQTHLLKGPDEATVQTKKCWMTSTKDIDDELSYTIIDEFCPVADAVAKADVDLITNGKSFISRWEVDVFKFTGQDNVFVHCRVRLCFKSDSQECDVFNCANRRKRRNVQEEDENNIKLEEYDQDDDITVSLGPLSVDDKVLEITIQTGSQGGLSQTTCIVIGAIVTVMFLALLILAFYRRRSKKEVEPEQAFEKDQF